MYNTVQHFPKTISHYFVYFEIATMLSHQKRAALSKNNNKTLLSKNSTCVSLQLPLSLACQNCEKDLDPLSSTRRKKKNNGRKTSRRKCLQQWKLDGRFNVSSSKIHMYQKIRSHLNIESDILFQTEPCKKRKIVDIDDNIKKGCNLKKLLLCFLVN